MSSVGTTTYRVSGLSLWALYTRLHMAAATSTTATFEAINLDDPNTPQEVRTFTVKVLQYDKASPETFFMEDQESKARFTLVYYTGATELDFEIIQ